METLLIRLLSKNQEESAPQAQWILLNSQKDPIDQAYYGELSTATELANHRRVIVLAPAQDTLIKTVSIKARNRQQLLKAVPYVLEEDLADDVDNLHFALGTRQTDGDYPVAIVARQRMDSWLKDLKYAGIMPHSIIPEALALPLIENRWSVLIENESSILRTGIKDFIVTEPEYLPSMLNMALKETSTPPDAINIYRCGNQTGVPIDIVDDSIDIVEYEDCPPYLFSAIPETGKLINLLQAGYKVKDNIIGMLRPWRIAAVLFTVWLGLQLFLGMSNYWQLSRDKAALETQIKRAFSDTFPEVQRIVNPRVQMEQKLKALQASSQGDASAQFLNFLDAGGRTINSTTDVKIGSLNYRQGRLQISLDANNLDSLDKIKQTLINEGFNAEIESAETTGQTVEARISIQGGKG